MECFSNQVILLGLHLFLRNFKPSKRIPPSCCISTNELTNTDGLNPLLLLGNAKCLSIRFVIFSSCIKVAIASNPPREVNRSSVDDMLCGNIFTNLGFIRCVFNLS